MDNKMQKSEIISLFFSGLFLLMCFVALFFMWQYTGCTPDNYQCSNIAGHISALFMFGCFLLLSPWLIVTLYAVCTATPARRRKANTLAFGPLVVLGPVPLWLVLCATSSSGGALVLTLICISLIVSDIIYFCTPETINKL